LFWMKEKGFAYHNQQQIVIDRRFVSQMDLDLRVVLSWDFDEIDIQLQCNEPNGDICSPFHNMTRIGGLLSKEFTGGYGPVEYLLRFAKSGTYQIIAKFASPKPVMLAGGEVTITLKVFSNFARDVESEHVVVARLSQVRESIILVTITV